MNILEINKVKYKIPSKWEEIPPQIFQRFAPKFFASKHFQEVICKFLELYIKKSKLYLLANYIDTIEKMLDFLKTPNFTYNPLPHFKYSGTKYYSAGERLKYVTLYEFSYLDTYHFHFYKSKSEDQKQKFLNLFMSILYREKGKNTNESDIRIEFNPQNAELKAKKNQKIPNWIKNTALLYFQNSKEFYVNKYPNVFEKPQTSQSAKAPDWNSLMIDLCGDDITKIEQVGKLPIPTAFLFLSEQKKKQIEQTKKNQYL